MATKRTERTRVLIDLEPGGTKRIRVTAAKQKTAPAVDEAAVPEIERRRCDVFHKIRKLTDGRG